jgi:membrane protein YqaA with SNARE-associated domain
MVDFALQFGYMGLFVFSFIAATLIAAPSDALAIAMPQFGYNPIWVVVVASLGGFFGNLLNYFIGKYGSDFLFARFGNFDEDSQWMKRAERFYQRYGVWTLLLSGTPFIGDPLTTVAGAFEVRLWAFCTLVLVGKVVKFVLLLGSTDAIVRFFSG